MLSKLFSKFIKANKQEEVIIPLDDQELIERACKQLLGKIVIASNCGGGFENVKLVSCEGVVFNDYHKVKEVKFKTDDDWIKYVYYEEKQISK